MTQSCKASSLSNKWKVESQFHMRKISIPLAIILILAFVLSGCTGTGIASSWPGILVQEDTIYTAYGQGVYAVSAGNGSLVWRYPEKAGKASFYARPTLTQDGQLIVGDYNNELHGLDAKTGTVRWTFKGEGRWIAQPVVESDTIYAANGDRNLYAINLNGGLVWKFQDKEPTMVESTGFGWDCIPGQHGPLSICY